MSTGTRGRRSPGVSTGFRVKPQATHVGVTLKTRHGEAYNERAFRYFLGIERKRSERSQRPFLLLLLNLRHQPGSPRQIDPELAGQVFSGLWQCVRETDFVGWLDEGRIAAAVLTQHGDGGGDVDKVVIERVREVLANLVSPTMGKRLRVRAYWMPRLPRERS